MRFFYQIFTRHSYYQIVRLIVFYNYLLSFKTQNSDLFSDRRTKYDSKKAWSLVEGVFGLFDIDKSGCLKKTEFLKFLGKIVVDLGGERPTIEACEDIMWQLDRNGDGQISKEEILVLFKQLIDILATMPQRPAGINRKRSN